MNNRFTKSAIQFNFLVLIAVFFTSVTVISLQVVLMRTLSIVRYHHFSYLVISTALMGFGISGTVLSFMFEKFKNKFQIWSLVIFALFVVSIVLSYYGAQNLEFDIQYVLYSTRHLLLMLVYNLIILIPFFFGGSILGMLLSYFNQNASTVYGADLLGSGIGGVAALNIMFLVQPIQLPGQMSVVAFLALLFWVIATPEYFSKRLRIFSILIILVSASFAVYSMLDKPEVKIDQYKMLSNMLRLEEQGDARHLLTGYSPRGRIDVYDSRRLHQTLFAGLGADVLPPAQLGIIQNGNLAGTILQVDSISQTEILDFTPQSIPYKLIDKPKVLLLGEVGGSNVWLARRYDASEIVVVQVNPQLIEILQHDLSEQSGNIYNADDVRIINQEPRLFLEQTKENFDIIQFVSSEGLAAGVSGTYSLHENYLLTVQGILHAAEILTDRGILSFTRGVQNPPRDNIKIFGTFVAALKKMNAESPGDYLLQGRNYLAMNTLLSSFKLSEQQIQRYQDLCQKLMMDAEYYPGIRSESINQINEISGPSGKNYSYFHYASMQILSPDKEQFYRDWVYHIEPSTDNQPYFYNFFKWSSLNRFVETYGRYWLQQLELGYVVLIITFVEVTLVALIFIVLPLFWLRTGLKNATNKLPTLIHFGSIGFGFLFLEMVFIQKFTKFLGDPIYSAAAALTSILVFAGLGSLLHQRVSKNPLNTIKMGVIGVICVAVFYLFSLDIILNQFIQFNTSTRFILTVIILFPIAFFMGWVFPSGLAVLRQTEEKLIPWAWGINGFTSVAASPLAILLSMSFGFQWVIVLAVLLYLQTGITTAFWKI